MSQETLKHFRYEIALGVAIPMPKPVINYYPHNQYSVQQYLHTLCKEHAGSLGKRDGKWAFGEDASSDVKLFNYPEVLQIFDFAEQMGVIDPQSPGEPAEGAFVTYKLSEKYQERFNKFAE